MSKNFLSLRRHFTKGRPRVIAVCALVTFAALGTLGALAWQNVLFPSFDISLRPFRISLNFSDVNGVNSRELTPALSEDSLKHPTLSHTTQTHDIATYDLSDPDQLASAITSALEPALTKIASTQINLRFNNVNITTTANDLGFNLNINSIMQTAIAPATTTSTTTTATELYQTISASPKEWLRNFFTAHGHFDTDKRSATHSDVKADRDTHSSYIPYITHDVALIKAVIQQGVSQDTGTATTENESRQGQQGADFTDKTESAHTTPHRSTQHMLSNPNIELVGGAFQPVSYKQKGTPDVQALISILHEIMFNVITATETPPSRIEDEIVDVPPVSITDESSIELAHQANTFTSGGARLQLKGTSGIVEIDEPTLRSFVIVKETTSPLNAPSNAPNDVPSDAPHTDTHKLDISAEIMPTLVKLFTDIYAKGSPATFDVDFSSNPKGEVVIKPGARHRKCCSSKAPEALATALLERIAISSMDTKSSSVNAKAVDTQSSTDVVQIPAKTVPHRQDKKWAKSLGVKTLVGEFTTKFKGGQSRVTNIQRISEITQGALIAPGASFSINKFVGRRTRAKGFVEGGMISHGVFVGSVGGGISQYATTLFNAAFFAGLDFGEYQSHSIYLKRYPYGREATVSYPYPDLVIKNTTPYTVMIWPTTTATSITVRLYSTPWAVGEQTGQTRTQQGKSCTRVTTTRTRKWLQDGSTTTDTVVARYRPEGIKCDGTSSVPTTTTTSPPTTTTTSPPTTTTTTTAPPTTSTTTTTVPTTTPTTTTAPPAKTTTTVPTTTTTAP